MPPQNSANPAIPSTAAELSAFLLRACHDLRGPVRTIRAHGELLSKKSAAAPDGELAQALNFILNGASLAISVIDGLTDYSLALGIDRSSFRPVPMEVILRAALAKLAAEIRRTEANVAYDSLPTVPGDSDRLLQLFEHLLDHAMRHRGADRLEIRISAEPHAEGWRFTVSDNGAGMDADLLDRAFSPFERLQGNERPGPGLATCRVIVERHGGKIWVESERGKGAAFHFTLPAD